MTTDTLHDLGDGLRMRPMRAEDAPRLVALFDDPDVTRMTSSFPLAFDHAFAVQMTERFAGFDGHANIGWVLEVDGAAAGTASLHLRAEGVYEIAYALGRTYWGRGLATRIARFAVDYAAGTLGARSVVAGCFQDNPASMRVLTKIGLVATGEVAEEFSRARGGPAPCARFALDLKPGALEADDLEACA